VTTTTDKETYEIDEEHDDDNNDNEDADELTIIAFKLLFAQWIEHAP
jgi:hypothetical protein